MPKRRPLDERVAEKILVRSLDECWPWQAAIGKVDGYGRIGTGEGTKTAPAHRVAFELFNGVTLPHDYEACHTCDYRPCCNPLHLWAGTTAQNIADMDRKGRRVKRTRTKKSEEIRLHYATGRITQKELARIHDVSQQNVSEIVRAPR